MVTYTIDLDEDHEWYPEEIDEQDDNKIEEELFSERAAHLEYTIEELHQHADNFRKDYWNDIAREIEMEKRAPDGTSIEVLEEDRVRFTTTHEDLAQELRQKDAEDSSSVEIERTTGDNLVAVLDRGEFQS